MILTNPVVISVIVLLALSLLKVNVFIALIISAIVGGLAAGMPVFAVTEFFSPLAAIPGITVAGSGEATIIDTLVGGMGGNSGTALSYVMLGAFAVALAHSGLGTLLSRKLAKVLHGRRLFMVFALAGIACFSQNLIPIHIAFIPILIPPLLKLMNSLKLDRRAVAVALTFGLKAPYIAIPVGFGAIFRDIVVGAINDNGGNVTQAQASSVMWIGALAMVIGLVVMGFFFGSKDRQYEDRPIIGEVDDDVEVTMNKEAWGALIAAIVTAVVSILTQSLPLAALLGLVTMMLTGCIKISQLDEMMNGGVAMMGFIAFVMLVAAGYGAVIRATGAVDTLVESAAVYMQGSKFIAAFVMLLIGLLVTMGIGSSFSTIPILAAIYVPLCLRLDFSPASIILLVAIAGALGDAGSPASDSTLGPTSGLNADGQHDHIWDTTVPTFIAFNIPLFIGGLIATMIFG